MKSLRQKLFEQQDSSAAQADLVKELDRLRNMYPEYDIRCTKNPRFAGDAYNAALYKKDGTYVAEIKGPAKLARCVEFLRHKLEHRSIKESMTKTRITVEVTGDAADTLKEFLGLLSSMGKMGCSREFVVIDFPDGSKTSFYFDGDGSDKLEIIEIKDITK